MMNYITHANNLRRNFCLSDNATNATTLHDESEYSETPAPTQGSFSRNLSICSTVSSITSTNSSELLKKLVGKVNLPGTKLGRIRNNKNDDMFGSLAKVGRQFQIHELLYNPVAGNDEFFRDFRQFVIQAELVSISEFDILTKNNNYDFKPKLCKSWSEYVKYHFYGWYKLIQSTDGKFVFDCIRGLNMTVFDNEFLNPVLEIRNESIFSVLKM